MSLAPFRQAPEATRVSTETDVKIPVLTAAWCAIAGDVAVLVVYLARFVWLVWSDGFRVAFSWVAEWWGPWVIALGVSWFFASLFLFVSFAVQTIDKHSPGTRRARNANDGLLSAWFPKLFGAAGVQRKGRRADGMYALLFGGGEDDE